MSEKNDNRFAQGPIEDTYWSSDKDKKLLSLQEQNKCHENSLMTLLKAKQDIEEENSKLKNKLEQSERNFLKKSKEADNLIGEKQTLEENINQQISQQTRVQKVEEENVIIKHKLQIKTKECDDLKTRIKCVEKDFDSIQKQFETKLKEYEDLKIRLSKEAGNTSIAALIDRFNPTRIAELFSELYDNEWTEAVDTLCDAQWSEEKIVQNLFITLQGCYETCCQLANLQMQELVQRLFLDLSSTDVSQYVQTHTTELKQLREARKSIACDVANVICKDFHNNKTFIDYIHSCSWSDADIVHQITKQKFFEKCITLCWLMVVQDPEMYLDGGVQRGTKFDKDRYREYTKSGPLFLCTIWPALYLHKNGPLMIKGVAQACG